MPEQDKTPKNYYYKDDSGKYYYTSAADSASVGLNNTKFHTDYASYKNFEAYSYLKNFINADEQGWDSKKNDFVSLWLERGKKSSLINNNPSPELRRRLRVWDSFISRDGIDLLRNEKDVTKRDANGNAQYKYDADSFRETYPDADYIQALTKNIGTDNGYKNMFVNAPRLLTRLGIDMGAGYVPPMGSWLVPVTAAGAVSPNIFNESELPLLNRLTTLAFPDKDYYKHDVDTKVEKLSFNIPYKQYGVFGVDAFAKDSDNKWKEFTSNLLEKYNLSVDYLNSLEGVTITQSESDYGGYDITIPKNLPGDMTAKILSCIPSSMLRGYYNLLKIDGIGYNDAGEETVLSKGSDHLDDNIAMVRELKNRVARLRDDMSKIDNTDMTTIKQVRAILADVPIDELLYDNSDEKFSDTKAKYDFYTNKAKTLLLNSADDVSNKYYVQGLDKDNLYHLIDNTNAEDIRKLVANAEIQVSGGTTGDDCGVLYTLLIGKENEKKLYKIYAPSLSPLTDYMQRDPNHVISAAETNSIAYDYPLPTLNGNLKFNMGQSKCEITDNSGKKYDCSIDEGRALLLASYLDVETESIITNAKNANNTLNLDRINYDLSDNNVTRTVLETFLKSYYPELYNAYADDNIIGVDGSKISKADFLNGNYDLNNVNQKTDIASRFIRQLINRMIQKRELINTAEPLYKNNTANTTNN